MKKEWIVENNCNSKKNTCKKKEFKPVSSSYDAYIKSNFIMEQNRLERIKEYKNPQ